MSKVSILPGAGRMAAIAIAALLPLVTSAQTVQVYVSPSGSDSASGLSSSTPVQTFTQAIYVVEIQRHQTTTQAAVINVAAGRYPLSKPILFDSLDSNLTVLGPTNGTATITGGVLLPTWTNYVPSKIRTRLSAAAKNWIYSAPVPTGNLGVLQRRGGPEPGIAFQNQPAELIVNGMPMSLARFPSTGWAYATSVAGDGVTSTLNMARRTMATTDAWVQGFWSSDGWETWEPLTGAPTTSQIQVSGLVTGVDMGPVTTGARFAVVNSLEDMSQRGQYYLDRTGDRIYFMPQTAITGATIELSQLDGYLFDGYQVNNLVFENLVFQASRGQGVQLYACTNSGLNDCTVQATQLEGVYLTGGSNNFVTNCEISNTGSCGILSIEGNVSTLTSGGDVISNNVFSGPGRMEQTCRPAVWIRGVGATVSSNTIANCPGQGIMYDGCNHLITQNDVSHTCMTMNDVGVIYTGQNILNRGNVISLNIIHDTPSLVTPRWGTPIIAGAYLDDFTSDVTVQENIFYNIPIGVLIGGGRSNTVYSNAFDAVGTPLWIDARGMTTEAGFFGSGGGYQTQLAALPPTELALYEATYPSFLNMVNASNPALPAGNAVSYAYFPSAGVGVLYEDSQYTISLLQVSNLLYNGNSIFVNAAQGNYNLVSGSGVTTTLPTSAGAGGVSGAIRRASQGGAS